MRQARVSNRLKVAAGLSVIVAASLCVGYVSDCGARLTQVTPGSSHYYRSHRLQVRQGSVLFYETFQPQPLQTQTFWIPIEPGNHLAWRFGFRDPDVRRSLWDFDYHYISADPADSVFLVEFPIWCLLITCLIAPILWLVRRPTVDPRGFEIS